MPLLTCSSPTLGGTKYVSVEKPLGILRGPGEGRGDAPGTIPLQNPHVTSRKACLRNAGTSTFLSPGVAA